MSKVKKQKNVWNPSKVRKVSEGMVYYNTTGASLEDMTYIANGLRSIYGWPFGRCMRYMLGIIGDYDSFDFTRHENREASQSPYSNANLLTNTIKYEKKNITNWY